MQSVTSYFHNFSIILLVT